MIPTELLVKYNISTNHMDDEECVYRTFLTVTDYEIIKSYETLMSEPTKFITNLATMYKNNKEVITWRVYAREQLNKLK